MENGLIFNFLKKEFKTSDDSVKDYVFKGVRMSEDVMYRYVYLLTEFLGLPKSYVRIEDEEDGSGSFYTVDVAELDSYSKSDDNEAEVENNNVDS